MGGSLKGARALKTGAGMAKINNQEVEASDGIDLGFSLAHDPVQKFNSSCMAFEGRVHNERPCGESFGSSVWGSTKRGACGWY
jgi:hypothetical protein